MFSFTQLPLWECCTEHRGGGRGRAHLRGGEGGRRPERCHLPQGGHTPLLLAADGGHTAVVEQLLAAGAAVDAKDEVRRGVGGWIGEGWVAEHSSACPLGFIVLCFSKFGFQLAARISKGICHVTTV